MGTKAFLQKGRTKPGVVLPADAVARVNQARDRTGLIREAQVKAEKATASPATEVQGPVVQASEPVPVQPEVQVAEAVAAPVVKVAAAAAAVEEVDATKLNVEPERQASVESASEVEVAPEPVAEPPASEPSATSSIMLVSGIGETLAERFATYGYGSLEALAQAEPDTINQIPGVRQRGRQWVEEARKRLGL